MTNPPIVPAGAAAGAAAGGAGGVFDGETDDAAIRESDGDLVLDEDVNDDLVDSAEADELASRDGAPNEGSEA